VCEEEPPLGHVRAWTDSVSAEKRGVVRQQIDEYVADVEAGRRIDGDLAIIDVIIHEGRNRQVRKMCEAVGHCVLGLRRTRIGPIADPKLPVGAWGDLSPREVQGAAACSRPPDAKGRCETIQACAAPCAEMAPYVPEDLVRAILAARGIAASSGGRSTRRFVSSDSPLSDFVAPPKCRSWIAPALSIAR
jgi:hypothetical protein